MATHDPTLQAHLHDLGRFDILDRDAELELIRQAQAGDTDARNELAEHHGRFVVYVAKQYRTDLELSDLIQEGHLGLLHAVSKFDVDSDFKFVSYAVWWIRQRIQAAIQDASPSGVRLPQSRAADVRAIARAREQLGNVGEEELAAAAGIKSVQKLRDIQAAAGAPVPLDAEGEEGDPIADAVLGGHTPDHDDGVAKLRRELEDRLAGLDERQQRVLTAYFSDDAPSLDAIGRSALLGRPMSREAVRLQKVAGLRALRSVV